MEGDLGSLQTALRQLHAANAGFAASDLTASGVAALVTEVRQAERTLTSIKVKVGQRSDELAKEMAGPGASETFAGVGDVSNRSARADTNRARTAADIPEAGNALDQGTIGGEHLDALARARNTVDSDLHELFDQCAGDLINRTDNTPVDAFNKHVRRLADRITNDHGLRTAQEQRAGSEYRTWTDRNGMGNLRATLDPELFEIVNNAVTRQSAAMAKQAKEAGDEVKVGPHLDALALVELVSHGNGARGRPDISIVVDADTILHGPHDASVRETVNGSELAYETIRRLCCDATIRTVRLDPSGVPIDVGRTHRTATARQWVALKSIYASCAWGSCDRPVTWCQAHHVTEWEHGGPTDLDNLVPLCNQHHHAVHEGQWNIKLLPDRTLRIFQPDGRHHADARPDRLDRDDRYVEHQTRRRLANI